MDIYFAPSGLLFAALFFTGLHPVLQTGKSFGLGSILFNKIVF